MASDSRIEYVCEGEGRHETSTPPNHKALTKCPVAPCSKALRRVGAGSRKANAR